MISAAVPLAALFLSCTETVEKPRIEVLSSDGARLSKTLYVPVDGGNIRLTVCSEADLDISYSQAVDSPEDWLELVSVIRTEADAYEINLSAKPLGNTLDLRSGTLGIRSPKDYIGAFLNVRQGYEPVWVQPFSDEPDGYLSLGPGESWESGPLTGISSVKDAFLAFEARADVAGGDYANYPLVLELSGGGYFHDIARSVYVTDVAPAAGFEAAPYHKYHIYNGGKVFSSESSLRVSVPSGAECRILLDNVTVYEIPVSSADAIGISEEDGEDEE